MIYRINYFKNWFQLHEIKCYGVNIKSFFSGIGQGKRPVDAVGRSVKYYATTKNLMRPHSNLKCSWIWWKIPQYTTAIYLYHLPKKEIESFIGIKLLEWKIQGIARHSENPYLEIFQRNQWSKTSARTSQMAMTEIKNTYKNVTYILIEKLKFSFK